MSKVGATLLILIIIVAAVAAYFLIQPAQPTPTKKVKVAILFDVGGRGDLSFNDMAYLGATKAQKDFGIEIETLTPKSLADMVPLLEDLSKRGEYDLLVLIGFLWTDALNKTADKFPDQKFALIDSTTGIARKNEVDILFREQECAAIVGVLASGMAKSLGGNKVGAVAGMDIPPLWKFHVGYLYGVKYYEKATGQKMDFVWQYTGTFTDTQAGYNAAMTLLQQDVKVLYGLAGLTHIGMFNAVKEWNSRQGKIAALAIGQDASQEWISPKDIPLSGAKRVDVAVYTAIEMVVKGTWKGGITTLGLKEGGVGIWDLDGVKEFATLAYEAKQLKDMTPDDVVKIVDQQRKAYIPEDTQRIADELKEKIMKGEIKFKTPANHEEYDSIIRELLSGNLDAALEKG
ncbi:BMP family ABC transporter substrate-binding protein [Candidatus Korarchaeum cryptofilum]|uniref:BMP family ABC transporter substrate-binding protein n=1 Tax=Candidatus Korarchaeum cryptofilum TaxID=498846 RepID=A0A429G1Q7_9CREN|nr:BMP family protein [Candidatus Korarchaeum cryptofilum]RSN67762.1 BMP family ABC transporter substrate-binding protein [Candidatus Korarchaeum cryptofilum]